MATIAGSGESREGGTTYRESTVRYGETSPDHSSDEFNWGPEQSAIRVVRTPASQP